MHCVDLGESFPTHIYLRSLASIQPRTRPVKFARSSNAAACGRTFGLNVASMALFWITERHTSVQQFRQVPKTPAKKPPRTSCFVVWVAEKDWS